MVERTPGELCSPGLIIDPFTWILDIPLANHPFNPLTSDPLNQNYKVMQINSGLVSILGRFFFLKVL